MVRVWTILGLCLSLSGCVDDLDGNGQRASETRELDHFAVVESAAALDVSIAQGDEYSAVVSIDSNLIDRVRTRVQGDRLVVDADGSIGDTLAGPHVRVTLPRLLAATLSGSGSVRIDSFDQDDALELTLSGSGEMAFSGSAPAISADLSGSGDIFLAGATDHVSLGLSGSGTIDAEELEADAGDIALGGSGDVRATIHDRARVALRGSGDIDLFGHPELELDKSGSGEVHRR